MIFIKAVCALWKEQLDADGYLVFECGFGQSGDVERIGRSAGLRHIETVSDTNGVARVAVFKNQIG